METNPVTSMKLTSVVPASVVGNNKTRHLTPIDLAMKLHYIRAVYFFKGRCDFTVADLKTTMFTLLQFYPHVSGRIRMTENVKEPSVVALPYIRCNDSGIRVIEAKVEEFTVEKWLELDDRCIDQRFLVFDHVLGPDLNFSPLVVIQITQFKCGGFSIGLSWAHIVGDILSASTFMKTLGHLISGHAPPEIMYPKTTELTTQSHKGEATTSIKKIESVGEYWLHINKCKMGRSTFNINIDHLIAKYTTQDQTFTEFDILYAFIWKSILNIRGETDTNIITICDRNKSSTCWNNDLVISTVERDGKVTEITELVALIASQKREETGLIRWMIEQDKGSSDFVTYGTNLTFVNCDMVDMYGFEIKGVKPDFVNYTIHGVGDKGVVLFFPKREFVRTVSVVMPEEELVKLKDEITNMIM